MDKMGHQWLIPKRPEHGGAVLHVARMDSRVECMRCGMIHWDGACVMQVDIIVDRYRNVSFHEILSGQLIPLYVCRLCLAAQTEWRIVSLAGSAAVPLRDTCRNTSATALEAFRCGTAAQAVGSRQA